MKCYELNLFFKSGDVLVNHVIL